jgi:hypothetical protein
MWETSAVQLDPALLPDDWPPEQALLVAEFLIALHDAIWDCYGRRVAWERSGPPPCASPVPAQLALPFGNAANVI